MMPPRWPTLRCLQLQCRGPVPKLRPTILCLSRISIPNTTVQRANYRGYGWEGQGPNRKRIVYTIETDRPPNGPPPPPPRHQRPPLQEAWATKPGFRYTVYTLAGGIVIFYVVNLERVPVTGRIRFNCVSNEVESMASQESYKEVLATYRGAFVSPYSRGAARVRRVAQRLIAVSGISDLDWEVHLIANPTPNAFVLPGGKIFVFTGILDVAKTDAQLAAVLSHEIAHTLAHHTAERLSSYYLVFGTIFTVCLLLGIHIGIGNIIADATILKPSSRKQETEADYIGLRILSQACYEPEAALTFWENMRRIERQSGQLGGGGVGDFFSTHPGTDDRIEKIRGWLPEAMQVREQSDCAQTDSMAGEFRRVFGTWRW